MAGINFKTIEKKWQAKWEKGKIFIVSEKKAKKKFYVLEMFAYPSGTGLHMGHAFNYTIGDVYARFKRMNGFDVLYPTGYDSLGLPAENAAIKAKAHPKTFTEKAIKNFIEQQKMLGLSYDWSRMIKTCDSDYYKWNQYFFLKFYENGLVYRKKAPVNFCSKCNTVLANEQVHDGKCWRHKDTNVEVKQLEQWFIKTTKYTEELLKDIKRLKWPEKIKKLQKNWIGKSFGTEIDFVINGEKWPIFTTRPDTIYGVTFMVVSAQHPRLMELVSSDRKKDVERFVKRLSSVSEEEIEQLEKEGVFTGSYAVNPINKEKIPVYAGNFVLADYGSGMVMAVPAHDQRDFEFAKKYKIPIRRVISGGNIKQKAYVDEGVIVNSSRFNGVGSKKAIEEITKFLEKKKLGRKAIQYRLKDWLISRQRYWGTPIPIVYCERCGVVPVSEKDLPVKLPERVKFGKGNPLKTAEKWIKVKCPKCGQIGKRETDTMDTFFDSSWYFLRFCDPRNKNSSFDKKRAGYWMPVDHYIGGAEHACMHLIYARFFTKALRDLGFLGFDEPFFRLFNQGMIHGKDGYVMSKSRGNVVNPLEVIKDYSADALRLYLISVASPDSDFTWDDKGLKVSSKFLKKVGDGFNRIKIGKSSARIESKVNKAIKEIGENIESFKYNLAVIKLRQLFEVFLNEKEISKKDFMSFLKLLHPFCPHITEELWFKIRGKGFISLADWPKADLKKIDKKLERAEQIVEKLIGDINNILRIISGKDEKAGKIYVYFLPKELEVYGEGLEMIKKRVSIDVEVFAVNDKKKYDPKGFAKKAKPGKPGIFVE